MGNRLLLVVLLGTLVNSGLLAALLLGAGPRFRAPPPPPLKVEIGTPRPLAEHGVRGCEDEGFAFDFSIVNQSLVPVEIVLSSGTEENVSDVVFLRPAGSGGAGPALFTLQPFASTRRHVGGRHNDRCAPASFTIQASRSNAGPILDHEPVRVAPMPAIAEGPDPQPVGAAGPLGEPAPFTYAISLECCDPDDPNVEEIEAAWSPLSKGTNSTPRDPDPVECGGGAARQQSVEVRSTLFADYRRGRDVTGLSAHGERCLVEVDIARAEAEEQ